MGYPLLLTTLVILLTLSKTFADVSSLQDNSYDHLDPLHDQEQDLTDNNQDKRTICSALNRCGSKSSYVKRLVIRKPQLLSFTPLIRPVAKPVLFGGYRYSKPRFHYRLKAPATLNGGWRPVQSASRPAVIGVASNKPHVDVIHNNPSPHVDHLSPSDVHNVATPVVRPVQPVQPAVVHLRPVALPAPHIDQIHQVNVPHGNHFDSFTHVDHLQPGIVAQPVAQPLVPIAQPVVPVAPSPTVVKPFVPSPVLFEVTKPNLGVLPLGARFQSPVLREYPHVHLHPVSPPVAPAVPVAPVSHPVQGIIHTPVGLPHIVPQPGVSVEYHGSKNFLALQGGAHFLQQTPAQPIPHQHIDAAHLHSHQHLPVEPGHSFAPQQALPFDHTHGFTQVQQQALPFNHAHAFAQAQQDLPLDHTHLFSQSHQPLPHDNGAQFSSTAQQFQQQQQQYQYQDIPQGQLPLEGEQQQSVDQYFQSNQEQFAQNGLNIQTFDQSNVIQPGQTDVQIPYHLPQHHGWSAVQQQGAQEEERSFGEQDFRPSQQLEAPYKK